MSQDFLQSDISSAESQDVPRELSRRHLPCEGLRALQRFPLLARQPSSGLEPLLDRSSHIQSIRSATERSTDVPPKSPRLRRLCADLRAFLSRFLALIRNPRCFAPIILDCLLLIRSTWSGLELGPDLVYPMLGIRKRQSGRLARLILEHSRDKRSCELQAETTLPQGIEPPCVAVIDLDQVPTNVTKNGYSTQVDLHGIMTMLILFDIFVTLLMNMFFLRGKGSLIWMNLGCDIFINLCLCLDAVLRGNGTLTLSRRSDTSTPRCAVLLDRDFTVILNGSNGIVEAIAESSFNLSYRPVLWSRLRLRKEERYQNLSYDALKALCEGSFSMVKWSFYGTLLQALWHFMPAPFNRWQWYLVLPALLVTAFLLPLIQRLGLPQIWTALLNIAPLSFTLVYLLVPKFPDTTPLDCHLGTAVLYAFLVGLFSAGYKARNYPIRSEKFLDSIGRPHIRKWQFNTLAAAATFQCLILCDGIARPITSVDVLAFLDMLIPDETDIWKVWKKRVADRIVRETDISFTPTIPMFRDDCQQKELVDLLDEARFGYEKYRELYVSGAPPPDSETSEDENPPSIFALIWAAFRRRS